MGIIDTQTRIAALAEDAIDTLGLQTVYRWTPRAVANWELPILFVSNTLEVDSYRQIEKQVNRDQTFIIRVLMQEVGLGWTQDLENREANLKDALFDLFNGNPTLRLDDNGPEGIDTSQWSGMRTITPFSFPGGQTTKQFHAIEATLIVRYSQFCHS